MSGPSVMKPLPTKLQEQAAHAKQSLCQLRSSNETNLAPPIPEDDEVNKKNTKK